MEYTAPNSLLRQLQVRIACAARANALRPKGTIALDIDIYSTEDHKKPIHEALWGVWDYKWTGKRWRKRQQLSGALEMEAALDRLELLARQRGLNTVNIY